MDTAERRRAPRLDAAGMPGSVSARARARVLHTASGARRNLRFLWRRKIKENTGTLHTHARYDTLLHYHARCVKVAAEARCRLAIVDNHAILGIVLQLVALEATLQHRRNVVRP